MSYQRVLLKLSGEALLGSRQYGVDPAKCLDIAAQVHTIREHGVEVAIVVGGSLLTAGLAMYLRQLVGSWALTLCLFGAFYIAVAAVLQMRSK